MTDPVAADAATSTGAANTVATALFPARAPGTPASRSNCAACARLLGIAKDRLARAADDVTLELAAGYMLALTAASSSGKSTLLHLIGAMERPDAGTIVVGGTEITALRRGALAGYRRSVGFVFQRYHLLPALTALSDHPRRPPVPDRTQQARPGARPVGRGGLAASSGCRPRCPAASSSGWRSPER